MQSVGHPGLMQMCKFEEAACAAPGLEEAGEDLAGYSHLHACLLEGVEEG